MKISCIQMNMKLGDREYNFAHADELIAQAVKAAPDVIVLPETWNTGFFPRERLAEMADSDAAETIRRIGALAKAYQVNIVAGSIANRKAAREKNAANASEKSTDERNAAGMCADGKTRNVYNTACVFDRCGNCIAAYDKVHLFSPMGEDDAFTAGDRICQFTLDGIPCGLIICYDLRFPEWVRKTALSGIDILFVVSQWPAARTSHLLALITARAIENQTFVACCNSCGMAYDTVYGGNSAILDPLGETITSAGAEEMILTADCDFSQIEAIRRSIPVFHDRRPELY